MNWRTMSALQKNEIFLLISFFWIVHFNLVSNKMCPLWPRARVYYKCEEIPDIELIEDLQLAIDAFNHHTPVAFFAYNKYHKNEGTFKSYVNIMFDDKAKNKHCGYTGLESQPLILTKKYNCTFYGKIVIPRKCCYVMQLLQVLGFPADEVVQQYTDDTSNKRNEYGGILKVYVDKLWELYFPMRWPWLNGTYFNEMKEFMDDKDYLDESNLELSIAI